jgi:hypothetical protein
MGKPEADAMFDSIVRRGILVCTATFWVAVVCLNLVRVGAGEEPAKKTDADFRETINRIAEWRYVLTRRTSVAVEADLDDRSIWSETNTTGASDEAWFVGRLGRMD